MVTWKFTDVNRRAQAVLQRVCEEGWNKHDVDAMVAAPGSNFVDHPAPHGVSRGVDGAREFATTYLTAFPGLHLSIEAVSTWL